MFLQEAKAYDRPNSTKKVWRTPDMKELDMHETMSSSEGEKGDRSLQDDVS